MCFGTKTRHSSFLSSVLLKLNDLEIEWALLIYHPKWHLKKMGIAPDRCAVKNKNDKHDKGENSPVELTPFPIYISLWLHYQQPQMQHCSQWKPRHSECPFRIICCKILQFDSLCIAPQSILLFSAALVCTDSGDTQWIQPGPLTGLKWQCLFGYRLF